MTFFRWYWLLWLVVGFGAMETYGLIWNPKATLSVTVWDWLGVMRNQPIGQWSVQHYLLLVFVVWFAGHMAFRIWR